jgi:hypothetical protein
MEPSAAIASIETALRLAIRTILGAAWHRANGAPDIDVLRSRQTEENRRRDGAVVSTDLLDYAMTTDLFALVLRNWELFKTVFDDRKRFDSHRSTVLDVRNTIAHSRPVVPFERDLLSGISGQLRNQVALFKGTMDESALYYPTIESAIDHQGHESHISSSLGLDSTLSRLSVGEELSFSCSAFMIDEIKIDWQLIAYKGYFMEPDWLPEGAWHGSGSTPQSRVIEATGEQVNLSYTLDRSDVGETLSFVVLMRSRAEFHRHGGPAWDDMRVFSYSVNPPRGG